MFNIRNFLLNYYYNSEWRERKRKRERERKRKEGERKRKRDGEERRKNICDEQLNKRVE